MAGRPTKYKPEYAEQAHKLCLLGHTNEELAKFFEVDTDTIYQWRKDFPEFSEAVLRGREVADAEVAKSFHKRAVGYRFDEITYEKVIKEVDGVSEEDDDMKLEIYKKKIVTKEVVPDAGAALNWLKNRQPKKWRDKQEVDHNVNNAGPAEEMTFEQAYMLKYGTKPPDSSGA